MPVTDILVALRVASSDALRPRVLLGSAVAVEATVIDQAGDFVAGATVTLALVQPGGAVLTQAGATTNAAGVATALFTPVAAGVHVGRATVTAPQAEVAERRFDVVATSVDPAAEDAAVLVTDDGEIILIDDGSGLEA